MWQWRSRIVVLRRYHNAVAAEAYVANRTERQRVVQRLPAQPAELRQPVACDTAEATRLKLKQMYSSRFAGWKLLRCCLHCAGCNI